MVDGFRCAQPILRTTHLLLPFLLPVLRVEPVGPFWIGWLREVGAWHDANETLHCAVSGMKRLLAGGLSHFAWRLVLAHSWPLCRGIYTVSRKRGSMAEHVRNPSRSLADR